MKQEFNDQNRDLLVNINGALVHRDDAGISPFDSSVQGGDAVWEGLRLYDGRIFRLTEHLDRLEASARAISFTDIPPREDIIQEIRRTLSANTMHDGVHIRLTLTRGLKVTSGMDPRLNTTGPTLIVLAEHKQPVYATTGVRLVTSSVRRFPPECLNANIHHANLIQSIMAKIEATDAGADDALMLDTQGFVAETNATHIFIVTRDVVRTPHTRSCPVGVTRGAVIEICGNEGIDCAAHDLTLEDIYEADEMFCTGTMGELTGVIKVDDRTIGTGQVGPMTRRLSELFRRLTASEGYGIA
ncbi:MAG: aminotransferase class IV [bacterium]|nr:aminotransferase class IV [bacterium]